MVPDVIDRHHRALCDCVLRHRLVALNTTRMCTIFTQPKIAQNYVKNNNFFSISPISLLRNENEMTVAVTRVKELRHDPVDTANKL